MCICMCFFLCVYMFIGLDACMHLCMHVCLLSVFMHNGYQKARFVKCTQSEEQVIRIGKRQMQSLYLIYVLTLSVKRPYSSSHYLIQDLVKEAACLFVI